MTNEYFQKKKNEHPTQVHSLTRHVCTVPFYRSDPEAASDALREKAADALKKYKFSDDEIDRILKSIAANVSWQVHLEGHDDDIGDSNESDSDESIDLAKMMAEKRRARQAVTKKNDERHSPKKKSR